MIRGSIAAAAFLACAWGGSLRAGPAKPDPEIAKAVASLGSDDFAERERAGERILALARKDPDAALAALEGEHEDPEVLNRCRELAAEVRRRRKLEPFEGEPALREAAAALLAEPSPERFEAFVAAAKDRPKEASALLCPFLESDRQDLQLQTILALAKLKEPASAVRIAGLLKTSKDPQIRMIVAAALGELRSPETKKALTDLLSDEAAEIRMVALSALGCYDDDALLPKMAVLLADPNPNVQQVAASAVLSQLGETAGEDPAESVRKAREIWAERAAKK